MFLGQLSYGREKTENDLSGLKQRDLVNEKERIRGKIIFEANTEDLAESYVDAIIEEVDKNMREAEEDGFEDYSNELSEVIDNLSNQKN